MVFCICESDISVYALLYMQNKLYIKLGRTEFHSGKKALD